MAAAEPVAAPAGPRVEAELVGHGAAEAQILDAWARGRPHHAWLIAGPAGIGKATFAFRVARFVLAGAGGDGGLFGAPADLAMDPDHPVFRRVAAGSHPDLMTLERLAGKDGRLATVISVDQVRAVGRFLHRTAGEGGWRVVIVDSADELNLNAANALLKLLEEPPPQALLLLVAHAPGGLLATIRSRCRRLGLMPLADADLDRLLARRLPDLPAPERRSLALLAEGSPGRALRLAEQGGLELYRTLVAVIGRADPVAAHDLAERLTRPGQGAAYDCVAELLPWWLARLARAAARGVLPPEVVAGEAEAGRRLLDRHGLERLVALWENIGATFARADGLNLDRRQAILDALTALGSNRS